MDTTRFAPSPTGLLHLGHAFAALYAFQAAASGRFLLRIEDLDRGRARPEHVRAIEQDLAWLGLSWPQPPLYQSSRSEAYRAALATLERRGVTYPCFCTRREILEEIERAAEAPHPSAAATDDTPAEGPRYPGTCRQLAAAERTRRLARGEPHAIRLDVASASAQAGALQFEELGAGPRGEHGLISVRAGQAGDIVLARKDLPAAYHLAVVLDDAYQQVTLVTRAADLFAATHVQRLLQALLALPAPRYAHHRVILDAQGRKLSKRDHAATLRSLRERGVSPAQIRTGLGFGAAAAVADGPGSSA